MAARKKSAKPANRVAARPARVRLHAKTRSQLAPRRVRARSRPRASTPLPAFAPNGRPTINGIGLVHHHMDYTSHDLEGMRRFFTETLGFTNVQQSPQRNSMTIHVTPTSSVGFVPPSGSAPEQWRPPGEPAFYLLVADVDRTFAQLHSRGVSFDQAPTDTPWGHRVAILKDPEGRTVCLAQDLKH